ncbi:MAG: proton-conducting transporter membrane subunit, partial [Verrucomicrobiota bacterium]
SMVALTKDNLKARLAYSTVSQLSYITLGAMLATSMGIMGGAFQIAMHAMGKITLFFCAGAIYTAAHKTEISDMDGLGRKMPFTYVAFLLGALSIIGLPPMGGSWSKWFLIAGSADAGHLAMVFVLLISSLLNIAYLLPIVARGFFARPNDTKEVDNPTGEPMGWTIKEAPLFCVVPLCLTALGTIVLFFYADPIYTFLKPMVE